MFFCTRIAFSLFDFWVASFDGPVPFLAAWLLFPKYCCCCCYCL